MLKPKRILIPMDFSEEAMLAFDWAVLFTKGVRDACVYPTYVYSSIPDLVALDVGRSAYKKVTHDWVEAEMAALRTALPKTVRCQPLYAAGKPAEEICGLCHTKGIDLVITTTHGRAGISHLLHGSVAEALARSAPCPVLILHLNRSMLEPVHDESSRRLMRPVQSESDMSRKGKLPF